LSTTYEKVLSELSAVEEPESELLTSLDESMVIKLLVDSVPKVDAVLGKYMSGTIEMTFGEPVTPLG
jgi:hypothetical protein